ncbi:PilT/PilU family type 4a pilus ATPase [Aquabacterium sp. OR-4]|uniref:PilT/PilU family type 4a pilus ATPase n=1 Tax=Aquabacterium sp. OR-4 TaxID=2978127 RepID=UPI0021B19A4C|nr:PilT/PilU family type 4a pilus ATPase [Aquabacterium sp. OR-4]MDT7834893.1 PilT/PilU family type 4a pilus ATPase [Aquabacterium sp. OR-4]
MSSRMERILRLMAERQASDVYLSANMPILIKIHGQMLQLSDQVLTPSQPRQLLAEILTPQQLEDLDDTGELNLAVSLDRVGSFRLSAFKQRGSIAGVVRHIPHDIPPLETLHLPSRLGELVLEKRGLILMVGATGSGKSTTLASMLELRNRTAPGHILTIEDPIEFLFQSKKCVVNQREVGRDTESIQVALRNALRQSPDCIMIGEIRDRETMTGALSYALSGHLVVASMHANNSYHALGRILSFYTPETRGVLLGDLAAGLRAVVSQRLLRANGGGRVPAVEVLLNSNLVAELIEKGDFPGIKEAMERSLAEGSRTFEEDLARLINDGTVTRDEGLAHSDSTTDLLWRLENQTTQASRAAPRRDESDDAQFNDFVVDIVPEGFKPQRMAGMPGGPPVQFPPVLR